MKRWVCKQCGLYQKAGGLNAIQVGRKVYFYRDEGNISNQTYDQINGEDIVRGVLIKSNHDHFTVLSSGRIFRVKAINIYLDNTTANFLYNMFGVCKC